jgi:hypothetical protein
MSGAENAVLAMFRWWNAAYAADEFTAEAFARHFVADVIFTVNGNVRGRDCAELAASFRRVKAATRDVRLVLPVVESFAANDRIFVQYRVEAVTDDGPAAEEAMAWAALAPDGRIARMTVMSRDLPATP